jgi:hypothetical protein
MSPLRWDVLLVAFVLALPVLALGLRGDLSVEDMTMRLPWCLAAGWGAVALLRKASTPPAQVKSRRPPRVHATDASSPDGEPSEF